MSRPALVKARPTTLPVFPALLRTSASAEAPPSADIVRAYKGLEEVERAFGTFKGPELEIRPIHHRLEDRVRARPINSDPVAKATRSRAAPTPRPSAPRAASAAAATAP